MNAVSKEKFRIPTWLREMIFRIVLLFFGFILAVLFLEVVFQFYSPYGDRFYESNELFGWRLIPNQSGWAKNEGGKRFVKINSKGLRDREYPYEKKENVFRILVLGDSQCEAAQVSLEDAFHKRLELLLNNRSDKLEYEVINCGVSGYGTDNELLFYRYEGSKYQPNIVILAFSVVNDFSDNFQGLSLNTRKPYFLPGETGLRLMNFPVKENSSLFRTVKNFLKSYSNLYRYLYNTFRNEYPDLGRILKKFGLMDSTPRRPKQNGIIRNYLLFETHYSPEWKKAVEVTKALILQLKKEVEANNSKLMVILIPKAEQVHMNQWLKLQEEYPTMKTKSWDLNKPNRILKEFLANVKIDVLDLLPEMRQYAKSENKQLYFGRGHWNSEGHRLSAQLLYDYMIRNNYIPIEDY